MLQLVDYILNALQPSEAEHVIVLDASDTEVPVGFNPLDVGDRDPHIVVDGIIAALAATFEEGWGSTHRVPHPRIAALARPRRAGAIRAIHPDRSADTPDRRRFPPPGHRCCPG
ncbi:hypothetical protein [Microbacterium sp. BH-3-3-3]|uniref:hypothetical protein n=1 Tax=Microbacterium sp. BH-3-3-3 TaxID=1906742 RepID=UPI000AD95E36|nr:hypothetical protein [Microbacterium sp. BH-3-3-3]